jgi:hypothetical protein
LRGYWYAGLGAALVVEVLFDTPVEFGFEFEQPPWALAVVDDDPDVSGQLQGTGIGPVTSGGGDMEAKKVGYK